MAKNDINIHVGVPGAETSEQKLNRLGKAGKGLGDKVSSGGRRGKQGLDELSNSASKSSGMFGKLKSSMMGWVAGLASIAAIVRGITTAIRIQKEAIEEHGRIAEQQQKKLLRLQHLGGFSEENPNLRKEVAAYAELGRRPFNEVADAWYNLRSKGGSLSSQQRRSIMYESLEMGRTDPELPLDTLIDMFSLYAKKAQSVDMNRVQNVLMQTITEAGGSGSDVARQMPKFLPIGMAGGLTSAESAGLWAYATTQTSDAAVATTGLRSVFMGLQGRGTPEGKEVLEQYGISSDMGFFDKITALSESYQSGKFSLGQAELLAGREGADILLSILQNPWAMNRTIANVMEADRGDIDITRSQIEELLGSDEFARLEDDIRQKIIAIENIKGSDIKALRWKRRKVAVDEAAHKQGMNAVQRWLLQLGETAQSVLGLEPGEFQEKFRSAEPMEAEIPQPTGTPVTVQADLEGYSQAGQTNITYDLSVNYYPKVGDDLSGPRFTQD